MCGVWRDAEAPRRFQLLYEGVAAAVVAGAGALLLSVMLLVWFTLVLVCLPTGRAYHLFEKTSVTELPLTRCSRKWLAHTICARDKETTIMLPSD